MSTTTHNPATDGLRLVTTLTTLVAVGLPLAAILTAEAREVEVMPSAIDWVFVGFVAAFTIATFALLVPWCLRGGPRRAVRGALSMSTFALLASSVAFWTMVPVVLGVAGGYVGQRERTRRATTGEPRGLATAATVLGAIAALGSVAAYVATS